MCYFVAVAFRAEAIDVARGLLRSAYRMHETTNPSLLRSLPPGWEVGFLSGETCGCDLYADPAQTGIEDAAETIDDRMERFRRKHTQPKYRKRGWTDHKIDRTIEQMRDDIERRPKSDLRGIRIDLRRAIADLASSAGPARVLAHNFSGDVEDETIRASHATVAATQFLTDDSLVAPDVWVEIVAKDARHT